MNEENVKRPTGKVGLLLMISGIILTALSIDLSDEIIALVGLTLILWGAILFYSRPNRYTKTQILIETYLSQIKLYNSQIKTNNYLGPITYFSPNNLWGLSNVITVIPKNQKGFDYTFNESDYYEISEDLIKITPHGLGISNLIEQELKIVASSIDLSYFKNKIKKALLDDLELLHDVHIEINDDKVQITMINSVFNEIIDEYLPDNKNVNGLIGDPLTSALACILAKITHKPILITNISFNPTNAEIISTLKICEF